MGNGVDICTFQHQHRYLSSKIYSDFFYLFLFKKHTPRSYSQKRESSNV